MVSVTNNFFINISLLSADACRVSPSQLPGSGLKVVHGTVSERHSAPQWLRHFYVRELSSQDRVRSGDFQNIHTAENVNCKVRIARPAATKKESYPTDGCSLDTLRLLERSAKHSSVLSNIAHFQLLYPVTVEAHCFVLGHFRGK